MNIINKLLSLFILLNFLDVATSYYCFSLGFYEINTLLSLLNIYEVLIFKIILLPISLYFIINTYEWLQIYLKADKKLIIFGQIFLLLFASLLMLNPLINNITVIISVI